MTETTSITSTAATSNLPENAIDIFVYSAIKDGNVNGDPDAGNQPRVNPANLHGIITDVKFKRLIRDGIKAIHNEPLFIDKANGSVEKLVLENGGKLQKDKKKVENSAEVNDKLLSQFIDNRLFGFTTGMTDSCNGPVTVSITESFDPVKLYHMSITRSLNSKDEKAEAGGAQFGDKSFVTFGLYRTLIQVNPSVCAKTGCTQEDIEKMISVLPHLYELWASAQKGEAYVYKVIIVRHTSKLRNLHAQPWKIEENIHVSLKPGVESPNSMNDYDFSIDEAAIKATGVQVEIIG